MSEIEPLTCAELIEMGGRVYRVPRTITAEGGEATERWIAEELLGAVPSEPPARMTRAELEAEALRLGLATSVPAEAEVQPDPALLVLGAPGKDLVNADFVRAIAVRRAALHDLAPTTTAGPDDGETANEEEA